MRKVPNSSGKEKCFSQKAMKYLEVWDENDQIFKIRLVNWEKVFMNSRARNNKTQLHLHMPPHPGKRLHLLLLLHFMTEERQGKGEVMKLIESDHLKITKIKWEALVCWSKMWRKRESLQPLQVAIFLLCGLIPKFAFWARCRESLCFVWLP